MKKITKKELLDYLAEDDYFSKEEVNRMLMKAFTFLGDELKKGNTIEIRGFASFIPYQISTKGFNFHTKKMCDIKDFKRVRVKISRGIITKINKN